jgi:hypothetical protein
MYDCFMPVSDYLAWCVLCAGCSCAARVVSSASRVPDFQVYCLRASYSSSRRTRPSIRLVHSPVLKVFPIDLSGERPTLIPFHLANLYSLVLANSFSVGVQVSCSQSILFRTNWYLGRFLCSSPAAIVRLLVPLRYSGGSDLR